MEFTLIKFIFIFGVLHSFIYLSFALGFSLVFGVAKIPYLSYAGLYTLSAYLMHLLLIKAGAPTIISAILSIGAVGGLSIVIGDYIVKPSMKNPLSIFISTMTVSFIVEEVFRIKMGLTPVALPALRGVITIAGVPVAQQWIAVLIIGAVSSFLVLIYLSKTATGKSIRAVAESWYESMIIGINPYKVFRVTMLIAGLLAGVASISLSPLKAVVPSMGWSPLFVSFAIVILGGMGSIKGTVVASFIYGFVEQFVTWKYGGAFASIVPLALIVLVLIFRPTGLFGEKE
jgi:branched-subunit amino acid ABC-type transport system permease component